MHEMNRSTTPKSEYKPRTEYMNNPNKKIVNKADTSQQYTKNR
jgi:hypothetical protein